MGRSIHGPPFSPRLPGRTMMRSVCQGIPPQKIRVPASMSPPAPAPQPPPPPPPKPTEATTNATTAIGCRVNVSENKDWMKKENRTTTKTTAITKQNDDNNHGEFPVSQGVLFHVLGLVRKPQNRITRPSLPSNPKHEILHRWPLTNQKNTHRMRTGKTFEVGHSRTENLKTTEASTSGTETMKPENPWPHIPKPWAKSSTPKP